MSNAAHLDKHMKSLKNPAKAKVLAGFFKTAPGQYGHGDQFLGITVPQSRIIAKTYAHLPVSELNILIQSPWHEIRVVSLFIAVAQFKKGTPQEQHTIVRFYLNNTKFINNWDLVDLSAYHVLGPWAHTKETTLLRKLARSNHLWEKRMAIVATFHFIRQGDAKETFAIADMLMQDEHDLMHKSIGWMLREVGKRVDRPTLEKYLQSRYKTMPRTMLRYAIEHFPQEQRQKYLQGKI